MGQLASSCSHAHGDGSRAKPSLAGASGNISKASPPRELQSAVATVLRGERDDERRHRARYRSGRVWLGAHGARRPHNSPREHEILGSDRRRDDRARPVAEALCLSPQDGGTTTFRVIRATLGGAHRCASRFLIAIGACLFRPRRKTGAEGALATFVCFERPLDARSGPAGNPPISDVNEGQTQSRRTFNPGDRGCRKLDGHGATPS